MQEPTPSWPFVPEASEGITDTNFTTRQRNAKWTLLECVVYAKVYYVTVVFTIIIIQPLTQGYDDRGIGMSESGVLVLHDCDASFSVTLDSNMYKLICLYWAGYASPHHGAGSAGVPAPGPVAPLQQQLEHASQKAGFVDDKYKPRPQVSSLLCYS